MDVRVAYVYDASLSDLRNRREQLEDQLAAAGLTQRWGIRETPSRNQLLLSLNADCSDKPRRASVSLIDLRAESGDLDQRGFKVCETIVRHPALCKVTRPVIWTDENTAANLRQAERVGAVAILDEEWAHRREGQPLAEVLDWVADQPSSPGEAVGAATRAFPPDSGSLIEEARTRDERFQRWFGFPPRKLHFALLWGMADAVELKFLRRYLTEAKYAKSERMVKRELERLQRAMSSQVETLDRPEPARAEIARRFLAEATPPEPPLLADLSWPSLDGVRELLYSRPDIVGWAYLAPGAEQLLKRFFNHVGATDHMAVEDRHAAINAAAVRVAAAMSRPEPIIHALLRSSTHAVNDAFCDWRDYGPPTRLI